MRSWKIIWQSYICVDLLGFFLDSKYVKVEAEPGHYDHEASGGQLALELGEFYISLHFYESSILGMWHIMPHNGKGLGRYTYFTEWLASNLFLAWCLFSSVEYRL